MLISRKQHQANRQNAQHSTGPVSPEGKAAVRLNALTFGLRARDIVLIHEDAAAYQQLWEVLESEWQPQAPTEKILLERMAVAHWLLMRTDRIEERVFTVTDPGAEQFALLDRVSAQRARLERSFSTAMRELKQLQNERRARPQPEPVQPLKSALAVTPPPAHRPAPPPAYVMSGAPGAQPLSCAPVSQDTR
ncbi:MAG: hypothetical protein ABSC93_07935 [Bryobacteraceae bacterium]|jgi:uncharacterized caspase-like protein